MAQPLRAAFPLRGPRAILALADGEAASRGAILRASDAAKAGTFSLSPAGHVLTIEELCIDEAWRGYGLGSDAARLIRAFAGRAGFATIRAPAPPGLGLSVYFWTRMGLHPLHGEGPGGGIWFERQLGIEGSRADPA